MVLRNSRRGAVVAVRNRRPAVPVRRRRAAAATGLLAAAGLVAGTSVAHAQQRAALVIGNATYAGDARLSQTVNDARAVAGALRDLDFDVILETNLDREGMDRATDEFIGKLRAGDVGVFYYAGHGLALDGGNYLAPVDFSASYDRVQARNRSLRADEVQQRMEEAGAGVSIVILDACRNNPFERTRSFTRGGLREMAHGGGLVAYATTPGDTAADDGRYARHLVSALRVPGLPAMELFTRVSVEIEAATQGDQVPMQQFGGAVGRFVFRPSPVTVAAELYEGAALRPAGPAGDGGGVASAGLKYRILRRGPRGEAVEVDPKTVFRSGDRIRFVFEPNIEGFLYVIQQGSSGEWSSLLPHPRIAGGRNRVVPFGEMAIPPGTWFRFDDRPGTERIFLYLSPDPVDALPGIDGAVIDVQSVEQRTVNDLAAGIGSMDLVFGDEEESAAPGATGEAMYVVNQTGSTVWWMVELRHE